jgi:hypothetical protein
METTQTLDRIEAPVRFYRSGEKTYFCLIDPNQHEVAISGGNGVVKIEVREISPPEKLRMEDFSQQKIHK